MAPIRVSLIIASRHRSDSLLRTIRAVRQQDHPLVELVVVADPATVDRLRATGLPARLVVFDQPNLAAARNEGLALAAGEVAAFLDDDAVPEPTWLSRLVAPFADPAVVASTGFVRGRNGFAFQWRAIEVDAAGQDHPIDVPQGISLHAGTHDRAIKTQGTNCAFRRDAVLAIGGFDPALRFYLDEADLNLRLAGHGLTAVVPAAEVHHAYAASALRRADRAPLSLFEIGASTAVFLRRHLPDGDHAAHLADLRQSQKARLVRLMVEGGLEPRDIGRLLATLDAGINDGGKRPLRPLTPLARTEAPFLPLPDMVPRPGRLIAGRVWQARRCRRQAQAAAARGDIVTLLLLGPTARPHRIAFDPAGYWVQRGGLFGRGDRSGGLIQPWTWRARVAAEARRIRACRPIDD